MAQKVVANNVREKEDGQLLAQIQELSPKDKLSLAIWLHENYIIKWPVPMQEQLAPEFSAAVLSIKKQIGNQATA